MNLTRKYWLIIFVSLSSGNHYGKRRNVQISALAGVAQWTEFRPANRKVAGLIPG